MKLLLQQQYRIELAVIRKNDFCANKILWWNCSVTSCPAQDREWYLSCSLTVRPLWRTKNGLNNSPRSESRAQSAEGVALSLSLSLQRKVTADNETSNFHDLVLLSCAHGHFMHCVLLHSTVCLNQLQPKDQPYSCLVCSFFISSYSCLQMN